MENLKEVDWSKAPSGATHYNEECGYPWLKESPPSYFNGDGWIEYEGTSYKRATEHIGNAVKRHQGWDGEEMSYEKYFKDVSGYDVIDVYRTHRIFGLNDEVLCHASKKLLLSGVRTGGKTLEQDVKEARDSLNRWLEMLAEDLGNSQEKDGWTPEAIESAEFKAVVENVDEFNKAKLCEYTLDEVVGDAVLSDWAVAVAVDKNGEVWEYEENPFVGNDDTAKKWYIPKGRLNRINKVVPPLNFKNCIWEVNK